MDLRDDSYSRFACLLAPFLLVNAIMDDDDDDDDSRSCQFSK